ncbi:MAG TPA: protoporphyrinogen oxidase [Thermodesulfobacteriaceae bacterium]|nr:protoporphyrinogen oxidase [Thermodesulfobacteriaceae bacterium]
MAKIVIIGAGMSGLSLGWYLRKYRPDRELLLLESSERAGGKAWTVEEDGFRCEKGVNGVLDNKPSTLGLAAELGLRPLKSSDSARRRYIVKNGSLIQLPESPAAFLNTNLLSIKGRLRVLMEILAPGGDPARDESLADFARRRLGREAFEYLIDPMATGIFAGDPEKLSLRSCFPRIHELERDYGSLIKAMILLQRKARKQGRSGPGAGPGGVLTSFPKGMSELADTAAAALAPHLRLNSPVASITRETGCWQVHLKSGETVDCSHVILACPAGPASEILKNSAPKLSRLAGEITYPPVTVVSLGIKKGTTEHPLDGFGFLAPGREKHSILGVLWDSSIFPNRSPDDYHLVRVLVGGARTPDLARLQDRSVLDLVLRELKDLIGLKNIPEFIKIFRWEEAIPQYMVGHSALENQIQSGLATHTGLFIRCNWIGGVSLNDCIANSQDLAEELSR